MIHRGLPFALLTLLLGALDLAGQAESPATLLIQVTDPEGMPASELSVDVLPGLALPFSSARYATGIIALPGPVLAQGTTDKEGRVQIELPHAGWYGVWAKRGDLAVAEQVVAVAPASLAQARHHRLTMRPGSRLTLTLTDDQGEPVAQAVAHAVDPLAVPPHRGFCGTGEQGPDLDDFISNDAGLVQVFVPDSGPAGRREQVWVAISRLGGEPVFAEISVKEHDNRHALAMGAVTTLSVRTEEVEGQEAGAWITLQTNRSVRESPGLPALHAHPWGQLLRTASHSARAHASAVHAATFVCAPGSVVEAQIDRSGGPPRGQTIPIPGERAASVVLALPLAHPRLRFLIVDESGAVQDAADFHFGFRVRKSGVFIAPFPSQDRKTGHMSLPVTAKDAASLVIAAKSLGRPPFVALKAPAVAIALDDLIPGQIRELETLQINPYPPLATGRTVDREGRPVPRVMLEVDLSGTSMTAYVRSNQRGVFVLPAIDRTPLLASVQARAGHHSEATCFSKGDDFEVVVEATFSARGRLRVSSSALLDQCELRFTSPRREYPITVKPGPDARFEVRDIPAGPCELEVRIGNLTAARVPFEIDADRPAAPPALQDIRVDESLGFVTIKVLGPDDQALAGVLVSIEEPDPERPNPESVGINRLGRTDGRGEATFVTRTNRGLTVDATPGPDLGPRLPRGVGEAPPARIRHRVQTFETLSSPLIVKLDYWPMLKIQIEPPPSSLTDERLELVLECDNQVIRPELVGASGLVWFDWVQGESCRLVLRRRVPHADPAAPSMGVEIGVIDLPTQGVIERELTLSPEQQEAIRALSK